MAKKTTAAASPPKTYASAMDKLRDEMAENAGNRYIQVVGEYLTDYLLDHPEAEAAILTDGKSIKGSLEAMRKVAEKQRHGNYAVITPEDGFSIVMGYFGIGEGERTTSSDPAEPGHLPLKGKAFGETAEDVSKKTGDLSKKVEDLSKKAEDVAETQPDPVDPFDLDALLASGFAGLSPSDPQDSPGETRDAKRGGALEGVI